MSVLPCPFNGRGERHISYYGLKKIGSIFGQSTVADDEWAREAER
jgi:hypothetical protein